MANEFPPFGVEDNLTEEQRRRLAAQQAQAPAGGVFEPDAGVPAAPPTQPAVPTAPAQPQGPSYTYEEFLKKQAADQAAKQQAAEVQKPTEPMGPRPYEEALGPVVSSMSSEAQKNFQSVRPIIDSAAKKVGIDPGMLYGIAYNESRFNPAAVGPEIKAGGAKGQRARGMFQFIPETFKRYAKKAGIENPDPHNPEHSALAAAFYSRDLLQRHKGDMRLALLDYAGAKSQEGIKRVSEKYIPNVEAFLTGVPFEGIEGQQTLGEPYVSPGDPRAMDLGGGIVKVPVSSKSVAGKRPVQEGFLQEQEELGQEQLDLVEEKSEQEQLLIKQKEVLTEGWLREAKNYKGNISRKRDAVYDSFVKTSQNLEKITTELADQKIDPGRFLKGDGGVMSWLGKGLLLISTIIGGYVEGLSMGRVKNQIPGMIQAAINRDIQAQRANLNSKIQQANLTKAQAQALFNRWSQLEDKYQANALRTAQLELGKIGLESDRLTAKRAVAEASLKIDSMLSNLRYKEQVEAGGKTTTTTSQRVVKKSAAGGSNFKKPTLGDIKLITETIGTMNRGKALMNDLKKIKNANKFTEVTGIFGTEWGQKIDELNSFARQVGRMLGTDKGNLAARDAAVMERALRGRTWGDAAKQAAQRILKLRKELEKKVGGSIDLMEAGGYDPRFIQKSRTMLQKNAVGGSSEKKLSFDIEQYKTSVK